MGSMAKFEGSICAATSAIISMARMPAVPGPLAGGSLFSSFGWFHTMTGSRVATKLKVMGVELASPADSVQVIFN